MNVGDLLDEDLLYDARLWADIYPIDPIEVRVRPMPGLLAIVLGREVSAITILRTVWVEDEALSGPPDRLHRLLAHELVHARQWRALGAARFLGRYLSEYVIGRLRGGSHSEAYRTISMEAEARTIAESVSRPRSR